MGRGMWTWVGIVVALVAALTLFAWWRSSTPATAFPIAEPTTVTAAAPKPEPDAGPQVVELKPVAPATTTITEMRAPVSGDTVGDAPATPEPPTPPSPSSPPEAPTTATDSPEPATGCAQPPATTTVAAPAVPKVITGRLGLYVARFDKGVSDFQPSRAISLNPTGQFPLASNYKQAVLLEVMRQIDAGTLKASERFKVTGANQSLGYYPFDNTPVLDLARRMIEWSDNTATDILHRRVGIGSLQPIADALRLCSTRLILPTKTWWTAQAGLGGPDFPRFGLVGASRKFATASFAEQLEIAGRLDAAAQRVTPDRLNAAVETYFAGRNGNRFSMAEIDRNLQNASTPAEWARFIHHAFVQSGLSAASQGKLRDILYHGKGRGFIRVPFRYFGGKSGNTARVLTYSGYLETLSGDRLIYVYMNDTSEELATRDQTPQAFYLINAALRKLMRPEDLKPPAKVAPKPDAAKTQKP